LSSSSYSSAVVVAYVLTGFSAPPSGGYFTGYCNAGTGCGNPASMSTSSSLSYSANAFIIGAGATCNSVTGYTRSITQGISGFTTTYDTGLNQHQYVGYNLPSSPGSTTFAMQADSGSSEVACWSDIGSQFLDPPGQAGPLTMTATPSSSVQIVSNRTQLVTSSAVLAVGGASLGSIVAVSVISPSCKDLGRRNKVGQPDSFS
jgi:hypothetical protein